MPGKGRGMTSQPSPQPPPLCSLKPKPWGGGWRREEKAEQNVWRSPQPGFPGPRFRGGDQGSGKGQRNQSKMGEGCGVTRGERQEGSSVLGDGESGSQEAGATRLSRIPFPLDSGHSVPCLGGHLCALVSRTPRSPVCWGTPRAQDSMPLGRKQMRTESCSCEDLGLWGERRMW